MITWRGTVTVKQIRHHLRFNLIRVRAAFEIFDSGDPGTTLLRRRGDDLWPLDVFLGLTPGQIGNLVLNVGLRREVTGIPGVPPGTFTAPDPLPLKQQGDDLLQDYTDTHRILDLPLPLEVLP